VEAIIDERSLGIKSVQIIYNMEFSRKMVEKITTMAMAIKSITKFKHGRYIISDKETYASLKSGLIETYEVFEDLRKKFLNDSKFRKALSTRVAIV
jgi:ubiquitin